MVKGLRFLVPTSAWIDSAVIAALITVLNSVLAPQDIGWRHLNPSPYFILPVLIGSRYGFGSGLVAGAAASVLVVLGDVYVAGVPFNTMIQRDGFFLGSLLFLGGLCGEIQHVFRRRELQLTSNNERNDERLKKLDAELFLLREAKAELERLLATRDSELSTLDAEMRRLFDAEPEELHQSILLLLNRHARVTDGAFYLAGERGILERKALIGGAEFLPERLDPTGVEMISLALKNKTSVSVPDFWERSIRQHKNYLLCVPLLDSKEAPMGAVVVTGMPFIALNKRTVRLVTLIGRWAARIIEIRKAPPEAFRALNGEASDKMLSRQFFQQNLELAFNTFRELNLPSSVVLFSLPTKAKTFQPDFEKAVIAGMRNGDFPAELSLPYPHVAVLLPLTGERGASIFVERIRFNCRSRSKFGDELQSRLVTFETQRSIDQVWQELTNHVERSAAAA